MKNFIAEVKEGIKAMIQMGLIMTISMVVIATTVYMLPGIMVDTHNVWVVASCAITIIGLTFLVHTILEME